MIGLLEGLIDFRKVSPPFHMRDLPREKFRVIFPNITCCECYRNFRIFVLPFWVRNLYPSILSVRSNTFACNIRKLQGERNFAARIVSGTRRFDHVTLAMKNLGWIPDKSHSYLRDAILAFKSMTAQLKKTTSAQILFPEGTLAVGRPSSIYRFLKPGRDRDIFITEL